MRHAARSLFAVLALLASSPHVRAVPPAPEPFTPMTAPATPIAGQPFSLLFTAATFGRDLVPATGPSASISGDRIVLRANAECDEPICDIPARNLFRVELPALAAGRYQLRIEGPVPYETTLDVVAAAPREMLRPAEGFWSAPGRPGTGVYLQPRGTTYGIGVFDHGRVFSSVVPVWSIDAPPLQGDTLVAALKRSSTSGSCLGCEPYQHFGVNLSTEPLRLRFESARRAFADFGDGSTLALVSLPFGVGYAEAALADTVDLQFGGPLPLPDLAGRWALHGESFGVANGVIRFGAAQRQPGGRVVFDGESEQGAWDYRLSCGPVAGDRRAGCDLLFTSPSPPATLGFVRLGDITEREMRFVPFAGTGATVAHAVRLP